MRKVILTNGEYYHIYNRGTDKRVIFPEKDYLERFFESMGEFNTIEPIGSIYENSFRKKHFGNAVSRQRKLVNITCYCLNPNHYHFIIEQLVDRGIAKFMHRLGVGYTKYFNQRLDRSGVLFQGPFKAMHIDSNEYLLYVSAYVNLNDKVHRLRNGVSKSSYEEYVENKESFCKKNIVLNQFKDVAEYKKFAEEALEIIRKRKDMEKLLIE
ncbi:MAG: transposase [Candidatus Portnoybacteria bacterium]|nr:transposase [Candidatus Portnoybacteria bacterium]